MTDLMTINLAKGHFNIVDGHDNLKADFNDFWLPNTRYEYRAKEYEAKLPPIAEAYDTAIKAKYTPEEIIDILIQLYFPLRFFHVGDYQRMALVLGFIGQRGSGKTCSAVEVAACDWLLRNDSVWSNVPIKIRVCYKDAEKIFESRSLDELDMLDLTEDYGGGCVLYDEVNMEAAEATRFSSSANLKFSYAMQQIRKRFLSVIWTCQGWSWIDNRLRWQTDFVIACRDASLEKKHYETSGLGDKTIWRVHDISGTSGSFDFDYEIKHKYITDYHVWDGINWLRPWWKAYNTDLLKGQNDYVRKYKVEAAEKEKAFNNQLPGAPGGILPGQTITLEQDIDAIIALGVDRVRCSDVWKQLGNNDRSVQSIVGRLFKQKGWIKAGDSRSGRYWKKVGVLNGK